MNAGTPLHKASDLQKLEILLMLRAHCAQGEGRMAHYAPGWSDERIFAETKNPEPGREWKLVYVKGMRLRHFGRIKSLDVERPAAAGASATIAALEQRLAEAEEWRALAEQRLQHVEQVLLNLGHRAYRAPVGRPPSSPPDEGNHKLAL